MSQTARTKSSIWGLIVPFIIAGLMIVAWTIYWFYTAHILETRLEGLKQSAIRSGFQLSYDPFKVKGYPFRMNVELHNFILLAPNDKGVEIPLLEAEANAYALGKWALNAPKGATIHRGLYGGATLGTMNLSATSLRASVSGFDQPVYNIAFTALDVHLQNQPAAHPFFFEKADVFEAYIRPSKTEGAADFLWRVSGAKGLPNSMAAMVGEGESVSLHLEGRVSKVTTLNGATVTSAVKDWKAAGGQLEGLKAQVQTPHQTLMATTEAIQLDDEQRPQGDIDLSLTGRLKPFFLLKSLGLITRDQADLLSPLMDMAFKTDGEQKLKLSYRDGGAYFGPVKVSDAPILIETRE